MDDTPTDCEPDGDISGLIIEPCTPPLDDPNGYVSQSADYWTKEAKKQMEKARKCIGLV